MSAPVVTQLPTAPARLSRPSNFVDESLVYLSSLPTLRTQVNMLSMYYNSIYANKWNLGKINGVRNFPSISQNTTQDIEYTGDAVAFTSQIDNFYYDLYLYSSSVNNISSWFESVITECGEAPYDVNKPMITGIHVPMSTMDSQDVFNTKATNFTESAIDNINSMYRSAFHTYMNCCSNKVYGSITASVTETIHLGMVSDTDLTY